MDEELLAQLRALKDAPAGLPGFRAALPTLPLFHRLGDPLRPGPLVLEIADTKSGRIEVGTDRCLFASVGVAAYLTPPLVLAFGPMEEPDARSRKPSPSGVCA